MLPVYVSRNLKIKISVYTDAASLRIQKPEKKNVQSTQMLPVYVRLQKPENKITIYTDAASLRLQKPE